MMVRFRRICFAALAAGALLALMAPGASAKKKGVPAHHFRQLPVSYQVRNLVSDGFVRADHFDPNLQNSWGIAFNPTATVWVANNKTGVATLFDGNGVSQSLIVTIPPLEGSTDPGNPTGVVFNGTSDFVVHKGAASGPARFIFATESGTIAGWAPNVDATHAITAADNSDSEAIYKGIALGADGTRFLLYATDFHNNKVDIFDTNFDAVTSPTAFVDRSIPRGFAPFGIQNIGGDIYVSYAKQDANAEDDVAGRGLGFVNVFDAQGKLIRRVASRGKLNAPWGMALAPASFGKFSGRLLVGNFGDGRINAFDAVDGTFKGQLRGPNGSPVEIDGLWGIAFGNGVKNQPTNTLFFAAGPDDEEHGVYGKITPTLSDGHDCRSDDWHDRYD